MSLYADRVAAKSAKSEAPSAARQQNRPIPRSALWHVLQLRTAQAKASSPSAAAGRSGLPARLKAGVERLSGIAMDDVRVHRNSAEPARLGALAFAQGCDIHLGPGQEAHLPHEAWHVVQQKQGRVVATAQLKNMSLNADSALEAEADRQGEIAAALAPAGPETVLQERGISQPVVQGKLRFLDTILEDKNLTDNPVPQRLLPHHLSKDIYQIRDDWVVGFKDIHLIFPDYVYLLGEHHGSGTWESQTKKWSRIGKMRESMKTVPGVKPEGAGPDLQPLESLHAFLLHACLHGKSRALALATSNAADLPKVLKDISWAAGQVLAAEPVYTKWAGTLPVDKSAKLEDDFLMAYVKHGVDAKIAQTLADNLITDLAKPSPDATTLERIKGSKVALASQIAVFAGLAADLAKVLRIGPQSASGVAISAELAAKAPVALKDSAAMAVREEAMVANIKAATRPLLVQVGDGHVESLGGKLDKVVKVRVGHDLATATKV
jgi:hypothetical protein